MLLTVFAGGGPCDYAQGSSAPHSVWRCKIKDYPLLNYPSSMPQEDKPITTARDERYDAQRIEQKWTERWQNDPSLYAAEAHSTKPKYYVLEMLPYPSGALHVDERVQRASSHGLGFVRAAGGECGHQEQHSS